MSAGTYYCFVRATDAAGNTSAWTATSPASVILPSPEAYVVGEWWPADQGVAGMTSSSVTASPPFNLVNVGQFSLDYMDVNADGMYVTGSGGSGTRAITRIDGASAPVKSIYVETQVTFSTTQNVISLTSTDYSSIDILIGGPNFNAPVGSMKVNSIGQADNNISYLPVGGGSTVRITVAASGRVCFYYSNGLRQDITVGSSLSTFSMSSRYLQIGAPFERLRLFSEEVYLGSSGEILMIQP